MSNKDFVRPYDEDYASWLDDRGYPRPDVREGNRLPTPAEVLAVLGSVPEGELELEAGDSYAFLIPRGSGPNGPYWLRLEAPARSSWKDETWDVSGYFTMRGDWDKELLVVAALAARCGQLLIYPDTGSVPVIVGIDDDPAVITHLLEEAEAEADEWQAFHRLRYG